MKIAVTGARGTVGTEVVKLCAEKGYHTIQVDRTEQKDDGKTPNTEHRTADVSGSYEATLEAFKGADAVIRMQSSS